MSSSSKQTSVLFILMFCFDFITSSYCLKTWVFFWFTLGVQEKNLAGVFQLLFLVLNCLLVRELVHVPWGKAFPQRDNDWMKWAFCCYHSKQSLKSLCFSVLKNLTLSSYRPLHVRTLPLWFFFIIGIITWKNPLVKVDWFFWLVLALRSEQPKKNHRVSCHQYFLYTPWE